MGFGTGGATSRFFQYSYPDPFVCPIRNDNIYAIPFDGRYLEEIMFNINIARSQLYGKEPITYRLYGSDGRVTESAYEPSFVYKTKSLFNNNLSIVNFLELVEQIKDAIEDTLEEPDGLKAHFARCFSMAYYTGLPFISTGLLAKDPSLKTSLENQGYPFYTFPENISGETMHGVFHRFDYVLPNVKHPLRDIAVKAFPKARGKLSEGIPLLTRMQNGEWPVTKSELATILGMSIFSKDPRRLPDKRSNSQTAFDKYKLTDSKRIFSSMCSFAIQMLRYNPPNMETFPYKSNLNNKVWAASYTYGAIFRDYACRVYYYNHTRNFTTHRFNSGKWAIGGIGGSLKDDGYMLRVPPPLNGGTLSWFAGDKRVLEIGIAPIGPWGFAPAYPMARYMDQDDRYDYFWNFHRYSTLEIATEDDEEWSAIKEPSRFGPNVTIELAYKVEGGYAYYPFVHTGGFYNDPLIDVGVNDAGVKSKWVTGNDGLLFENRYKVSPNELVFAKLPVKKAPLYNLFKEGNTPPDALTTYGNWITAIKVHWNDRSQWKKYCGSVTPNIDGYNHVAIKRIAILDDYVRPPEDFLYPND